MQFLGSYSIEYIDFNNLDKYINWKMNSCPPCLHSNKQDNHCFIFTLIFGLIMRLCTISCFLFSRALDENSSTCIHKHAYGHTTSLYTLCY